MGENIFKQSNWQEINLQNIKTACAAPWKKKKKKTIKWAEDLK